jgi:hypothetical protein
VYLSLNTISPPKVVTQLPKPNKDLSGARREAAGGGSESGWGESREERERPGGGEK